MDEWHVNQFYLALLDGEACHIMGVHQHIFEKSSMFNSFLSLQNWPLLIKWLGEDISKLIIGVHTLNANVPFLLVISNEIMADIYVLCS
jgi:hypothetical protein